MAKNYPDYDTLREQYEAGNISAVDFVTQQSSALAFMDFREELFEESVSN